MKTKKDVIFGLYGDEQDLLKAVKVANEKQLEIMQTLLAMIEPTAKKAGCLSFGVFSDIEDKNLLNLLEEWQTRKDLDRHLRSEMFSVLLGTKSLLCDPSQIQILTVSHSERMESVNATRGTGT